MCQHSKTKSYLWHNSSSDNHNIPEDPVGTPHFLWPIYTSENYCPCFIWNSLHCFIHNILLAVCNHNEVLGQNLAQSKSNPKFWTSWKSRFQGLWLKCWIIFTWSLPASMSESSRRSSTATCSSSMATSSMATSLLFSCCQHDQHQHYLNQHRHHDGNQNTHLHWFFLSVLDGDSGRSRLRKSCRKSSILYIYSHHH